MNVGTSSSYSTPCLHKRALTNTSQLFSQSVTSLSSYSRPGRALHRQSTTSNKLGGRTLKPQATGASISGSQPLEEPGIKAQANSTSVSSDNPLLRVVSGVLLGALGSFAIYAGGLLFTGTLLALAASPA